MVKLYVMNFIETNFILDESQHFKNSFAFSVGLIKIISVRGWMSFQQHFNVTLHNTSNQYLDSICTVGIGLSCDS